MVESVSNATLTRTIQEVDTLLDRAARRLDGLMLVRSKFVSFMIEDDDKGKQKRHAILRHPATWSVTHSDVGNSTLVGADILLKDLTDDQFNLLVAFASAEITVKVVLSGISGGDSAKVKAIYAESDYRH